MLKHINVGRSSQRAHSRKDAKKKHFRPTAVAVITKGDKVLLVYSEKSKSWGPVKGGIHKGESLIKAVWREIKEEIGLTPEDFEERYRYLGSATDKGFAGKMKSQDFANCKHLHVVHLRLKRRHRKLKLEEGKITAFKFVGNRESFMALPMKSRRQQILVNALQRVGISWA
tara:strand:- start:350 stop:862 length:513 start_codon:yes stop_codon:yes gene_type:complete